VTDYQARKKIASLVALAKRPGTPAEGKSARAAAIRLAKKYHIECEFVKQDTFNRWWEEITKSAAKETPKTKADSSDWIKKLQKLGWEINQNYNTKYAHAVTLMRGLSRAYYFQFYDGGKEIEYESNYHSFSEPRSFRNLDDFIKASEQKREKPFDVDADIRRSAAAFKRDFGRY
jgi:hypothetical protein